MKKGFSLDKAKRHRYGKAAYFFADGLDEPLDLAREWTVDRMCPGYQRAHYAVLKAIARVEERCLLDTTKSEGKKTYRYFRGKYYERVRAGEIKIDSKKEKDTESFIMDELVIALATKVALFEALTPRSAMNQMRFKEHVTNSVIMAVYDVSVVLRESIQIVDEGLCNEI